MTHDVFEAYRELSRRQGLAVEHADEDSYLEFLRSKLEDNPLTMNLYFHYKGFKAGFFALETIQENTNDFV